MKKIRKASAILVALLASLPVLAEAAVAIEDRTYNANESICWPCVTAEDSAASHRINLHTEGEAHAFLRKVMHTKEVSGGEPVQAHLSYEVMRNDDILSIVFTEYRYVGKAAHPMVDLRTMNFRVASGESLSADSLEGTGPGGPYAPETVTRKLRDWADRENIPLKANFTELTSVPQSFYFDADHHVHFIFQQNEVAPAAAGIIDLDADA
ncbi:MAG: hypothetical protein IJS96_00300 [Schwartzia sp.]|nr:hypothetical protein [Schwartzia sp. (in: firmicutes)]